MKVGNWTKLAALIIVNMGIIILMYFLVVPAEVGVPVLAASLGYVFGNGQAVVERKTNSH